MGCLFERVFLWATGTYVLLLLLSRLLALLPDLFSPMSLLSPLVVATVGCLVFHHRPTRVETAHLIDERADTGDLFLTNVLLEKSPESYAPIVRVQARDRSGSVLPSQIVPYIWHRPALRLVGVLAVVALAARFLPQLDPFGHEEDRLRIVQQEKNLENTRKATTMRRKALKAKKPEERLSKKTQSMLDALKLTFATMKPEERKRNAERLVRQKKTVTNQWRKTAGEKFRRAMDGQNASQKFGGMRNPKAAEWRKQLAKGNASALQKELKELKKLAEKLAETTDPEEARRLKRELSRRLKQVADFAKNEMGTPELAAAAERAMKQMAMTEMDKMTKDALKALAESMDLASLEAEATAQAMRDMQALEQAMQAMQMARRANAKGAKGLDGKKAGQPAGIESYMDYYEKLLREMGDGKGTGGGMGGEGTGKGNKAPEDDTAKSDFTSEQDPTLLSSGKLLLKWKTKGAAPTGRSREAYRESLRKVKQGVNEAIERENVPPGYHEAIRKYFDSMGAKDDGT